MSEERVVDGDEPLETLRAVLEDPTSGPRRLPKLVGQLEADEESVRIGAAWTTCFVAAQNPDMVDYLTRRLVDRLDADDPSLETELVFSYVGARFPEVVADELDAIEEGASDRTTALPIEGSLGRGLRGAQEFRRRGVGRLRIAGADGPPGPRQVYSEEGEAEPDGADTESEPDGPATEAEPADEKGEAETDDADDGPGATPDGVAARRESHGVLPEIVYRSRFDQLTVLAERDRGRYGKVYRTRGVLDGEEFPVALVLFELPEEDRSAFANALNTQLARWAAVSDHDGIVTVHDWGLRPRPWAAVEFTGPRLADRDRLPFEEACWSACTLAEATEYAHENGVLHGAIDPSNVAYFGNALTEEERQRPLLAGVALMPVFRQYFSPTEYLDPRYAAPEYYERRFGRIDHATDVYQLGAVIYRLVTGRPPYVGTFAEVRRSVLEGSPPRPSAVGDLPAALDDVVTKAMARRKLRRYETASHLKQDLAALGGGDGGETDAG